MQTSTLEQALRAALSALLPFLVGTGGCLATAGVTGCQSDDVARAFGYTTPGIHASYSVFGASIDVSSDLKGFVEIDWNTNGVLHAKATLNSNVSAVTKAQGERIHENFLEGRRIEWDGKERIALSVGPNLMAFGAMVSQVTDSVGKEAAVPIIGHIAETLRGSGGSFNLEGIGGGSFGLGQPPPAKTEPPDQVEGG